MIDNIDTNKVVVSNKVSFGKKDFKFFIDYKNAKKIRSLYIFLPKMSAYRRCFDKTKCMFFLIKNEKLLEKYNKICKKVSNIINKEFDSKPVYNEKYLKTKIKSYDGKIKTSFHNIKIPKEGSHCICPSVIMIDSAYRKDRDYYSQVFLEESKYVNMLLKKKRCLRLLLTTQKFLLIILIEKILIKKILMKKII